MWENHRKRCLIQKTIPPAFVQLAVFANWSCLASGFWRKGRCPRTAPSVAVSGNFHSRTCEEEFRRMNARRARQMRYESGTRTSKKDISWVVTSRKWREHPLKWRANLQKHAPKGSKPSSVRRDCWLLDSSPMLRWSPKQCCWLSSRHIPWENDTNTYSQIQTPDTGDARNFAYHSNAATRHIWPNSGHLSKRSSKFANLDQVW